MSRCFPWRSPRLGVAALSAAVMSLAPAHAEDPLVLYGAGSLREVMTEITRAFTSAEGVPVSTQFAASGRMRERIETGEKVDIFTSADIGHARRLVEEGRASVMTMFAQNTLCLLVPSRGGSVNSDGVLDSMLKDGIKVGVSPPKIDPLGDYTFELFSVAGRVKSGAAERLQARAIVLDNPPDSPQARTGDYVLDAVEDKKVDVAVVYCSARQRYASLSTDVKMVEMPPSLRVGPQLGVAVMKGARPEASLLALRILSPEGQQILERNGFRSIALPDRQ